MGRHVDEGRGEVTALRCIALDHTVTDISYAQLRDRTSRFAQVLTDGLMWLQHRLQLADRAASRLDQKLRLLRAALLRGQEGVRPPAEQLPAECRSRGPTPLGTTYPAHGSCGTSEPDRASPRWVPRLEASLAELRLSLGEAELAEHIRLRWAADREVAAR